MKYSQIFRRLLNLRPQTTRRNQKNNSQSAGLAPTLGREFDVNDKEDIKYLNSLKHSFSESVAKSDAEGNETDRSLSSQLTLITTVLITANIIVFGNKDLLGTLTYSHKFLLLAGLFSLMASLWWGIEYYRTVKTFHAKWADSKQKIYLLISNVDFKNYGQLREKMAEAYKGLGAHINEKFLNRQISALKVALFVYLIFVVALLFDFKLANHLHWYK
jgi:hypothetical protein